MPDVPGHLAFAWGGWEQLSRMGRSTGFGPGPLRIEAAYAWMDENGVLGPARDDLIELWMALDAVWLGHDDEWRPGRDED